MALVIWYFVLVWVSDVVVAKDGLPDDSVKCCREVDVVPDGGNVFAREVSSGKCCDVYGVGGRPPGQSSALGGSECFCEEVGEVLSEEGVVNLRYLRC